MAAIKEVLASDPELAAVPIFFEENKATKPPAKGVWLTFEPSASDARVTTLGANAEYRESFAVDVLFMCPAGHGADAPKALGRRLFDLLRSKPAHNDVRFSKVSLPFASEDMTGQWFFVSVEVSGERDF